MFTIPEGVIYYVGALNDWYWDASECSTCCEASGLLSTPVSAIFLGFQYTVTGATAFDYGKEMGAPVYVYRFVNMMRHSRPKYNSVISTFCWAVVLKRVHCK